MDDLRYKIVEKAFEYRDATFDLTNKLMDLSDEEVLKLAEDDDFASSSVKGRDISLELFLLLDQLEAKEGRVRS